MNAAQRVAAMVPFPAGNVDQGIVKKFRGASKMFSGEATSTYRARAKEIESTVPRETP